MKKPIFFKTSKAFAEENNQNNHILKKILERKSPMSYPQFKDLVKISSIADPGDEDAYELFMNGNDDIKYYRSSFNGSELFFLETNGAQFIFTEDKKSPEELFDKNLIQDSEYAYH